MRSALRLVLAGALLFAIALPPAAAARAGAPYGLVASNAIFVPGNTFKERLAAYRRLHRAGVRAIRLDINWAAIEPAGRPLHDYDFTERDREVRAIRKAGMKVIGIVDYGHPDYSVLGAFVGGTPLGGGIPPFYVANAQFFPPDDPASFAHFASRAAAHFRHRFPGEVIGWEVWNEENEGWRFWPPHEDPAAYGRLLCAADRALRSADPGTPVVFGGLFFPGVAGAPGMSAVDFVQAAYDANPNLGHCYDVMAYHPYPYPFTAPELDVPVRGSVLSAYDQMRAVLRVNGSGHKPLWVTEVGWPTHDRTYGVPEAKQAQYVARMEAASFAQGLPVLAWYTYGDSADPTGANQEAWFGFFRPDGSPKPSYRALRTFARVFRRARFRRDLSSRLGLPTGEQDLGGRGFALRYVRHHRGVTTRITALWLACESAEDAQGPAPACSAPESVRVKLPTHSRAVRAVTYLGKERRRRAHGGRVSLRIGPGPTYVVDRAIGTG
jgi:polysaccharide biosynthesis protein PslG